MNYPDLSSFGLDPWWLVLAKALGIFVFLVLTVLVAILLERRVLSWMQMRIGPNRVGPFGLLQSLADGIKLSLKEGLVPAGVDKPIYLLAPIISVKVVAGIDEAIAHINHYSSHHSEAIVTNNHPKAMRFLREVDSASVMINASTRFADGFEYGLGAEIGISTDKIHARGPVGLEGLTSQKWVVLGDGHVRG